MTIENYIDNLNQRYTLGNATEHTFRGDLQQLLETLLPDIRATNEPKRQKCGAPDYILTKKEIPVGFIEAKDIGDKDLLGKKKTGNKEQFDRYKASLSNLIFTDYIDFHIYRDSELITKIAIAEVVDNQIKPLPENFETFTNLIKDFTTHISQSIKSSKRLAEMMAGKARLLSDVIEKALNSDNEHLEDSTLKEQMTAFKEILIHDITPKGFADVYAQTIAYGLFAARLHDPTLDTFSRQEAAELIPKSNPFLRKLFGYIAGADIDDRIKWIVDNLAEIFLACNVEEILKNYGKSTKMEDPIIHFYETFLAEYDPKLRKARGVWYTPAPVVNFIVRAVDDILKTEFDLPQGLADSSKTTVKVKTDIANKNFKSGYKEVDKEVHKVQVLDPATGTGTFLAEVIKHVHKKFKGQEGIWSSYAENNLLPRLNGFELLMASYAMAHLQIDLLLRETGFKATRNQRTKIYLTNSLEEYHPDTGTLFANWLSSEANEANHIKRDTPVMCIIGNPPYSGESANKGDWIMSLMDDYKKEPGGKVKLKERNPKWINDDYVKFLRYGQHFIEKNGTGVLAFINPHGFLDNPTFRGMRWNLLKTYDKIYTIDLHGNSKKKETAPDGSADVNVFDIMQGVSINIFIKTGKKKTNELGKVFHYDLFGKRDFKYDFLNDNSIKNIDFTELPNIAPDYYMVQKDFESQGKYNKGICLTDLFILNNVGIVTSRDSFVIDENKQTLVNRIKDFFILESDEILNNYKLRENKTWKINKVKQKEKQFETECIKSISYRPFDNRFIYYNNSFIERTRLEVMQHLQKEPNLAIAVKRQSKLDFSYIFITNRLTESCLFESAYANNSTLPLYLYPEQTNQQTTENSPERIPNLNLEIIKEISKKLELTFTNEKEQTKNTFAPIDILDYIYAVLHSPTYREKYKEFLKIDFPRVPYPKDQATFWQLVKLGKEIREIHLLESETVENYITSYPETGDNIITRKLTKTNIGYEPITETLGKVWINDTQYFNNVPLVAWEFYIGGYQPAQKWLKDRKDRELSFEDILHYQKIIVALSETHRLMQEIDTIEIE
ncbi:N-6 DNA methylase [Polaribacter sp. R2A056_3_33]|uniref:type ISP restriction/modification enzyme n=1 Tax=Polaribacter sp. R2A056_3_33 TaxID=2745563 RepID=UPI001C4F8921|nr:type ISP restriction/modification enzyme [Polaribacter sp. R2A056_3_33]QXP71149.1 N-6 DNA methylase [Polaribacter sp. R2A056_3_33]